MGDQGWELVAATSYSEGGGVAIGGVGSSSYTIKFLYLFKRELPPLTPELEAQWQDLINRIPQKYRYVIWKLEGLSEINHNS